MIFDAKTLFCQDEVAIYTEDTEAEIRAQQEEMWYMQEAKRIEEEAYQAQYGSGISDPYDDINEQNDKRLKGVRIK
jgi:DICT domain-containing protein